MPAPLQRIEIVADRVASDIGTLRRGTSPYVELGEARRLIAIGAAKPFEVEERALSPTERARELGAPDVAIAAKRNARVDRMARGSVAR